MIALLAQIAAALVIGHATPVQCAAISGGHQGWYNAPAQTIVLSPAVCDLLGQPPRSYGFPYGVFVLLHEAEHASGVEDESRASCRALADAPRMLRAAAIPPPVVRFDVAVIGALVRWQQGVVC